MSNFPNDIPYHKTKIGEHDFHKPVCFQYCKMNGRFCPFISNDQGLSGNSLRIKSASTTRWTDIEDDRVNKVKDSGRHFDPVFSDNLYNIGSLQSVQKKIEQNKNFKWANSDKQQCSNESGSMGFTCWSDGSGFQYDKMSQNVIGPGYGLQSSVYDITNYGIQHKPLRFSQWNDWIDKMQYDYRFGQVSDQNAQTILFPNVDNPWMFTQYVFQGIGSDKNKKLCALNIPEQYIVQPPIYDPKTLEIINCDYQVDDVEKDYEGKYKQYCNRLNPIIDLSQSEIKIKWGVKQYRQIINWTDITRFSSEDVKINQEEVQEEQRPSDEAIAHLLNEKSYYSVCNDNGVKLYKASLPVQSVKWGQHGNVPPGTIDMTAPAQWFNPSNSVTRFEAVYDAHIGTPFYSPYDGVVTWREKTYAYVREATFSSDINEDDYTYDYNYGSGYDDNETKALDMPQTTGRIINGKLVQGGRTITATEVLIGAGAQQEYVHRGCALCHGVNKKLHCDYIDNLSNIDLKNEMIQYFSPAYCLDPQKEHTCPHYIGIAQAKPIATYQVELTSLYQTSIGGNKQVNSALTMAVFGGAVGALFGLEVGTRAINDQINQFNQNIEGRNRKVQVTYSVKYKPVTSSNQPVKLNKDIDEKTNQYKRGIQILPGTGRYAIQKGGNDSFGGIGGWDTNILGDISTLSFHRFFRSVMHCSDQSSCNMIMGPSHAEGFSLTEKAGKQCRYYNNGLESNSLIGCPYNCVPKRAVQFCSVAEKMYELISSYARSYSQRTQLGIWQLDWDILPDSELKFLSRYSVVFMSKEGEQIRERPYTYQRIEGQPVYNLNGRGEEDSCRTSLHYRDNDHLQWIVFDEWAVTQLSDNVAVIAVKVEKPGEIGDVIPFSSLFGGASLFNDKMAPEGYYVAFQIKTTKETKRIKLNWNIDPGTLRVVPGIIQPPKDYDTNEDYYINIPVYHTSSLYFWYQPLKNDGSILYDGEHYSFNSELMSPNDVSSYKTPEYDYNKSKDKKEWNVPANLRQHVDKNGLWFCRAENNFANPKTNCVMVDNSQKFIGGYHPEYKDYSKCGSQFMQQIVSDDERQGQAIGDEFAGTSGYRTIPQAVNQKGYWIDQSGTYIVDELEIGYDQEIAYASDRATTGGRGGSVCISFKKSNKQVDGSTGKTKPSKVVNGAVFANDPYELVCHWYNEPDRDENGNVILDQFRNRTGLNPMIPNPEKQNELYLASCYVGNKFLLPTMRQAIHCPVCDYYLSYKYVGIERCPWCGTEYEIIKGSTGEQFAEKLAEGPEKDSILSAMHGRSWQELQDQIKHDEGKDKIPPLTIKKFFKIKSIGNVEVWAPPGTALKTDAYFWKHQTRITNALKRQIVNKLGNAKNGKYTHDRISPISDMTLGYPEWIGKFQQVSPEGVVYDEVSPEGVVYDEENQNKRCGFDHIKWMKKYYDNYLYKGNVVGMFNGTMPRHMIPQFYFDENEYQDQGVIAPYSYLPKASEIVGNNEPQYKEVRQDALKLVSFDQLTNLRNRIQPIVAYASYDTNNGQYPVLRASYDDRQNANQAVIYQGRKSKVSSVVLASTDDGRDSYQDYYSGDMAYGVVRQHFPSGYTWWYMKQTLGGRFTHRNGGTYHMDDKENGYMSGGSGGLYTLGERTQARCAVFLHGLLPLDKQILKAYLIISPSSENPSKNPIGLPWSTSGRVMYHHYHAMEALPNREDGPGGKKGQPHFGDGVMPHLHGTAGKKDGYYDDVGVWVSTKKQKGTSYVTYDSDDIQFQDQSAHRLYGKDSHSIVDDRYVYYEDNFRDMIGSLRGLYDVSFYRNVGINKINVYNKNDESNITDNTKPIGTGYDSSCFSQDFGFETINFNFIQQKKDKKFQYLVLDDNKDLVYKYDPSQIWKSGISSDIQNTIDRNTYEIQFSVTDGTKENTESYIFTETDKQVYQTVSNQSQGITGYFNMEWTNTKGYSYGRYKVDYGEGYQNWDAPVIFQDEGIGSPSYSGSSEIISTGMTQRCLDVTKAVKNAYNSRVARDFVCTGGASFNDIASFKFYKVSGTMENKKDDVYFQNSQIFIEIVSNNSSYLLNDIYTYPDIENLNDSVPQIPTNGDKYPLKEGEVIIFARLDTNQFEVNQYNDKFFISDLNASEDEIQEKKFNWGYGSKITQLDEENNFMEAVKHIMNSLGNSSADFTFQKISKNEIKITSKIGISIKGGKLQTHSIVSLFHLVGDHIPIQNRFVQVTNYKNGFHPNMMNYNSDKGWKYDIYEDDVQYVVIDLLRAPLCKQQRSWRTKGASLNYASAKCPSSGCKANKMGCAYAASMSGKFFDKQTSTCPICNASLVNAAGVVKTPGDGIPTYKYDEPFSPNPFISVISIKPWNDVYGNCSYSISYKEHGGQVWKPLNNYNLIEQNGRYNYYIENDEANKTGAPKIRARFIKINCHTYPYLNKEEYKISQRNGYQIIVQREDGTQFTDMGNFSFAGIYIDVCKKNGQDDYQILSDKNTDKLRILAAHIMDNKKYMKIALNKPFNIDLDSVGESNYDSEESSSGEDDSSSSETPYNPIYVIRFDSIKYRGGFNCAEIYGYHYKTNQSESVPGTNSGKMFLKITDTYDAFRAQITNYGSKYSLPQVPIQIVRVSVGSYDNQEILLKDCGYDLSDSDFEGSSHEQKIRSLVNDNVNFYWKTQTVKYDLNSGTVIEDNEGGDNEGGEDDEGGEDNEGGESDNTITFKRIKQGMYYYDYEYGNIYLPLKDQKGTYFYKFQENLQLNNIKKKFKPGTLFVSYWAGNGKEITLQARANGHGPSYMLQKNAITKIVKWKDKNFQLKEGTNETKICTYKPIAAKKFCPIIDTTSDSEGYSYKKNITQYPWIVYNNVPSNLSIDIASRSNNKQGSQKYNAGQFRLPTFFGNELCKDSGEDDEMGTKFIALFGEHCQGLWGMCTTQVTFIGPPDTIISGQIHVRAQALTTYNVKVDGTTSYTYTQRTGGLNTGIIVCKVAPSDTNAANRVTKCYTKPNLVIFASQANKYTIRSNM